MLLGSVSSTKHPSTHSDMSMKTLFCIGSMLRALEHRFVGASARPIHQRVSGTSTVGSHHDRSAHKELLECLAELPRHPTVDCKVDWVAHYDEEVGEEDERIGD